MIRRDDGNDWLLIRQVEHARLAAQVAAVWGNDTCSGLPRADLLVWVIDHHDDGWNAWTRAPQIDPANGKPRNFTEMPMGVATDLWRQSIAICAKRDPLGGIWVSKHFCWLAKGARENRGDAPEELAAIDDFLHAQVRLTNEWRKDVDQPKSSEEVDRSIEAGFRLVQFFDYLSLWLCCAERTDPGEIDCPERGRIQLTPITPYRISLKPYPLSVSELRLTVSAKRVAARAYADDADLAHALSEAHTEEMTWKLSSHASLSESSAT
jgi:hypothetical protein